MAIYTGQFEGIIRSTDQSKSTYWLCIQVGSIGEARLYGMGYANDKLYGFSGSGVIVEIDPYTGWSPFMKEVNELSWWGATTNPVRWE